MAGSEPTYEELALIRNSVYLAKIARRDGSYPSLADFDSRQRRCPMTQSDNISIEELRQWVRYDPETGYLWWLKRPSSKAKMTSPAGSIRRDGRINFRLKDINYKAHRVCWALYYGEWPEKDIDHINCIPDDNRIANLRLATKAENNSNMRKKPGCTSQYKGVSWDRNWRCWRAYIRKNGTLHRLGNFSDEKEAHAAYCRAASEMKGEFARYG